MPSDKLAVNRQSTPKKKRGPGKPFTGKGDPRNNLAGAPRRGESWAETVRWWGDMTGPEAAAKCLMLAKQLLELGDGITLRDAAVLSAFRQLINDPTGAMFVALSARAEGQPEQSISHSWKDEARKQGIDPDELSRTLIEQFKTAMVRASISRGLGSGDGTGEAE